MMSEKGVFMRVTSVEFDDRLATRRFLGYAHVSLDNQYTIRNISVNYHLVFSLQMPKSEYHRLAEYTPLPDKALYDEIAEAVIKRACQNRLLNVSFC